MAGVKGAARRWGAGVFAALPETARVRLYPAGTGYRARDVPPPITPPQGDARLLIAPVNYAGQAHHWARAAATLPGVGAMNMQHRRDTDGFSFASDLVVPMPVFQRSRVWATRHFEAVANGFTHVLVEAVRPIFGCLFDGDVEAEVRALREAGVQVGMIVHGTDVRRPADHRQSHRWSPYHDGDPGWVREQEERADRNRGVLERVAAPIFASTTTLAHTVPTSTWLPVTIRPDDWQAHGEPLLRRRPVVVHAPSSGPMKGTAFIRRSVAPLVAEGLVEYREHAGVPASQMPAVYAAADIVIDAVRMGNYGAASCEAMASGRVVVVHLSELARSDAIIRGVAPPVFETDPIRLEQTLRGILDDRAAARRIARNGPGFVREIHDGRRAARVLAPFLGVDVHGGG